MFLAILFHNLVLKRNRKKENENDKITISLSFFNLCISKIKKKSNKEKTGEKMCWASLVYLVGSMKFTGYFRFYSR